MDHLHSWRRIVNTLYCSDPVCNAKSTLFLQDGKLVKCYNCRQSFLLYAQNYDNKYGNLQCPECGDGVPTITLERQQKILNEIISTDVLKVIERKADKEARRVGRNGEKLNVEFEELSKELNRKTQEIEANSKELQELRRGIDRKLLRLKEKRAEFAGYIKAQRAAIRIERAELRERAQKDLEETMQARRVMKANLEVAFSRKLEEVEREKEHWKATYAPKKVGRPSKKDLEMEVVQVEGQEVTKGELGDIVSRLLTKNLTEEETQE